MPVERRAVRDVDAIVSRCDDAPVDAADTAAVMSHGRVVDAIGAVAEAMLPMRFGERFADERAVKTALESRLPEVRRGLARVRGCVELSVRVLGRSSPDDDAPDAADGSAYMRSRLARLTEWQALVAAAHEPLDSLARESIVSSDARPEVVRTAPIHHGAYLIPRERLGEFSAAVDRFATAHPELTVVCTGPWAPHSFSALEGIDAAAPRAGGGRS
jgi:hypothetical protein